MSEGTHRRWKWGTIRQDDVRLVNCAGCGVEMLGQTQPGRLPDEAKGVWPLVHFYLPDEERPHSDHMRPYCYVCSQIVMARAG